MESPELQRLFPDCDVNSSEGIEFEDFTVVCKKLSVSERDAETLLDELRSSEEGHIDYSSYSCKFQEVTQTLNLASFGEGAVPTVWEAFVSRLGGEGLLSESLEGQLAELHQVIQASENVTLLRPYEEVIQAVVSQSLENKQQCERLESSLKLAEELRDCQLVDMEDDVQQQIAKTENRVREEEQKKLEGTLAAMKTKHEDEIAGLQAAVNKLIKSQEESELLKSRDDVLELKTQINNLSQENEQLRCSLLQANTEVSMLRSEIDKLKEMCEDQKAHYERENEELKKMVLEYQSYSSQIQSLQEYNKKLYDCNDELRSALVDQVPKAKRRLSPENDFPARKIKPLRQSTLIHGSSEQNSVSVVASWAEKYLDSGVSLQMDMADTSGSDYDSDDDRISVETVHRSYSYIPSDVETAEVKSEAGFSLAPSKASSRASSLRRPLSAFAIQPLEESIVETAKPAPMYRLVLAGDAGAGKSSFLLRLTLNEFRSDMQTTLGVDFQMKVMLVDGEMTNLQIWDTAGQERFRSIARSYFRKAHGVLLLYDVSSERSFLNVRAWVDQIQDSSDVKIPVCVIGNKVDLREELPAGSCVSSTEGEKLAKAYGALFCETSAKEGSNVTEAVLHLAREVKLNSTLWQRSESQVKLSETIPKKTLNSCCGL